MLFDAIGSAGTPETQALLVKLINHVNLGREQTRSSLINLSKSKDPPQETIQALRDATDDPSHGSQAIYSLASAPFSLRSHRPQAAVALVQELIRRLDSVDEGHRKGN